MKNKITIAIGLMSFVVIAAATILEDGETYLGEAEGTTDMKVQGFYLSASEDCSDPVPVFENASAGYTDFTKSLNIGGGDIQDGTYHCAILKISDQMRQVVRSLPPLCTTQGTGELGVTTVSAPGTTQRDIYAAGSLTTDNSGTIIEKGDDLDGITIEPSDEEQSVYLYFTTDTNAAGSRIFNQPGPTLMDVAIHGGARLNEPIVISGNTNISFKLKAIRMESSGPGSAETPLGINPTLMSVSKRSSLNNGTEESFCEGTTGDVVFEVTNY